MPALAAQPTEREKRGIMTDVLVPTCMTGRKQREEPHEHVPWVRARDDIANAIERADERFHEQVLTRADQPGPGHRRGQW